MRDQEGPETATARRQAHESLSDPTTAGDRRLLRVKPSVDIAPCTGKRKVMVASYTQLLHCKALASCLMATWFPLGQSHEYGNQQFLSTRF
jgi:hypothetical protein